MRQVLASEQVRQNITGRGSRVDAGFLWKQRFIRIFGMAQCWHIHCFPLLTTSVNIMVPAGNAAPRALKGICCEKRILAAGYRAISPLDPLLRLSATDRDGRCYLSE